VLFRSILAAFAAAMVIAALAPSEAKLGDTVKLIYLHASITWVSLATFVVAAIVGIAALIRRSGALAVWSRASLATATAYWIGHFLIGLVVMKLAWGGWFWSEPRVRAGMLILGVSIAATLVALSIYITIPTNDPEEIPLPLEGAWIPAPEWYGLLPLLPFKYFTGPLVALLAIYIPALLFFTLAFIPFAFRRKKREEEAEGEAGAVPVSDVYDDVAEEAALKGSDVIEGAGNDTRSSKKPGIGMALVRGAVVLAVFAIVFGLIYLGNYESPTYGCNSCHAVSGQGREVGPDLARIGHRLSPTELREYETRDDPRI